MKNLLLALFLAGSAAAHAGQLVYVPAAGVYVDVDTGDVHVSGGRNVAINPDNGHVTTPGDYEPAPRQPQRIKQARQSAPAPLTCAQEAYQLGRQERAVQYMGNHDPNYDSAYYAWQARSQSHARRCQ